MSCVLLYVFNSIIHSFFLLAVVVTETRSVTTVIVVTVTPVTDTVTGTEVVIEIVIAGYVAFVYS